MRPPTILAGSLCEAQNDNAVDTPVRSAHGRGATLEGFDASGGQVLEARHAPTVWVSLGVVRPIQRQRVRVRDHLAVQLGHRLYHQGTHGGDDNVGGADLGYAPDRGRRPVCADPGR